MKTPFLCIALLATLALCFAGCATEKPVDYSAFREHRPRSILVLPPLNNSTDIKGTYSYLSTVTRPLAEMGYYVFPVAEVDECLKENGMPTAGEMHQVPLNKVSEILGADAVLYITLNKYGSEYHIINSATTVEVSAKLVDTKTAVTLWEGHAMAKEDSSDVEDSPIDSESSLIGALIDAAVTQVVNSKTDEAHDVSKEANYDLFTTKNKGLLYGPYNPEFAKEK